MRASVLIGRVALATVVIPTTYDPANKHPSVSLSTDNLVATASVTGTNGVKSIASRGAGRYHAEFLSSTGSASIARYGFVTAAQNVGANAATPFIQLNNANIEVDGAAVAAVAGGAAHGKWVAIEFDAGSREFWVQVAGEARQGPFSVSGTGEFFAWTSVNNGRSVTANFGQSAFAVAVTDGFAPGFG